jgi:hypothetical protein
MKTQNFGIFINRTINIFFSHWFLVICVPVCLKNYKENRENGNEGDDPNWKIPEDGKYTWVKGEVKGDYVYGVKENDGDYHYECRYDEGSGDKKWMEEKDLNYLARLNLIGPNNDTEIKALSENKERAEKAALEVKSVKLEQLSPALKKFMEEKKRIEKQKQKELQEKKQLEEQKKELFLEQSKKYCCSITQQKEKDSKVSLGNNSITHFGNNKTPDNEKNKENDEKIIDKKDDTKTPQEFKQN